MKTSYDVRDPAPTPRTQTHKITCQSCRTTHTLEVPTIGYLRWRTGTLIQNAMPTLTDDERELLKTGMCGSCFDDLFAEEDA